MSESNDGFEMQEIPEEKTQNPYKIEKRRNDELKILREVEEKRRNDEVKELRELEKFNKKYRIFLETQIYSAENLIKAYNSLITKKFISEDTNKEYEYRELIKEENKKLKNLKSELLKLGEPEFSSKGGKKHNKKSKRKIKSNKRRRTRRY